MRSTIEVHVDGVWVPAATIHTFDGQAHKATFEYLFEYVFGDIAHPVSLTAPVNANRLGFDSAGQAPTCPSFLFDLVPQGKGRDFLCGELKFPNHEGSDLKLAQFGAFNPIGNLRIDTAVDFYLVRTSADSGAGVTEADIVHRREAFINHLASHSMLAAGTTGVQGAAAKFLLTQNLDGLWFADAALADENAASHWLVKLPRGSHETDLQILRNEAAYGRVAQACGLRCLAPPEFKGDLLFFRRFDRIV